MFKHRMRLLKSIALVFAVILLAASGQLGTCADTGSPADVVERAWSNVRSAGSYRFSSDITETLIPQALPGMVGQQETTIGFELDGAVQLPDRSYMEMRTTASNRAVPAIVVLRDAGQTYISQNGKLQTAENPSGIAMPEADALGYLGAAENVRLLEDIPAAGEAVTRFVFDINGSRLAERVRAQSEAALRARPGAPADVSVGDLPMFQRLSGQGELWLNADGLPVRQIVDLEMPSVDDLYQTRFHMVVDLRDYGLVRALPRVVQRADGALQLEGAVSVGQQVGLGEPDSAITPKTLFRVSPTMLALFVVAFCLIVATRYYRRNPKRAYTIIVSVVAPILIVGPLLQAGSMVQFREAEARAAEARSAVASQSLQALGLAREDVESRPAPELDLSLRDTQLQSTPASGAQAPTRSLLTETVADEDYIEHCGQGSPTDDTDGDGLNDQLEGCLGTDPYEADSDNDGLSDGVEKAGFDYSGKHWVLNPKNTDSNGDSLSDYEELSTALGGLSAKLDADDDGIPNPWDDDNDGDGVLDYADLSSEAVSPYAPAQNLDIQGGSFDGHQYIEFQVQPEDQTHLRYATTALDWPFDDKGNVQDLDSSTDDVRLTPFMLITANVVPTELTREYGVRVWQHNGETIMMAPLQPVTDGGHTMAFYGKVVYSPDLAGRLDNISWNMKMVWMVQATLDSWVNGDVEPKVSVLNQFTDTFRFSGLLVTRSRGYEVGVIGTPTTPVEDRNLFAVRQGMLLFYLGFEELEFQEPGQTALGQVQARFANPATPISYTWGVTPSLVAMDRISYSHRDAGLAGVGGDLVQDFLNTHYNYDLSDVTKLAVAVNDDGDSYYFKATSLLLATEEQAGTLGLEDAATETAGTLRINLSDIPIVTARNVKLVMYEMLESGKWEMMAPSRLMQVVELRYRNRLGEINNPDYPDLLPNDYRFVLYMSYLSASIGMSVAIAVDGQLLTEATPEYKGGWITVDLMNAVWSQVGYWVPNYMAIVTGVGESLQKLRSIDWWGRLTGQKAADFVDEFSHLTPDVFAESLRPTRLQLADKWVGRVSMVFGAVVGAATLVMNVLQMACGEGEDFACGNEKAFNIAGIVTGWACAATQAVSIASMAIQMVTKTLEAFKGVTAGLAVVGTVLGVGAAWVTFGLTIAGAADNPVVIRNAVALVIATTIWLTFLLLINLVPVVGQIISAILCLIDTIISLITSLICGSENSWSVARALAEFFYKAEVLTSLVADPGPEYYDWSTALRDENSGLVAGNAIELSSQFSGQMQKESAGSDSDLRSSWVKGEAFYGPATQGNPVNANTYAECTVSNGILYCHNMPKIIFGLPTARINNRLQFEVITSFQYRFSESTLAGLVTTKSSKQGSIPDDDEDPEYNDFYLDVQPASLDGWWTWREIANPDQDGDGLTDSQEATLGTDPTMWDSDGDSLSDGFEDERGSDGFDPLQADSDQDGLNDMIEFRLGTKSNQCDSDQDGLWDSEEVYHRKSYAWDPCTGAIGDWVGGWKARMIGGEEIWVTSDPLKALTDVDSLSDLAERQNAYSPWSRNDAAALSLALSPWASGENARPGMFVAPGDNVKLTLALANYGTAAVTDTMTLCIANGIAGLSGGSLYGDRPMDATVGSCEGGVSYSWSFAGAQTLQRGEEVTTTLSGKAINTSTSVYGNITVTLPYSDTVLTQASPFVIDADNPSANISTPAADAVLRGSTYVVGGSASDPSSWVARMELGIGPQGSGKTFTEAAGTNSWAYSWSLPGDGRYELQARATDYVGHSALSAIVPVVVDNTPPTVVITSQGTVTSTGNIVTLTGSVTDNLSGVARVQVSVNNQAWRTVQVTGVGTLNASWSYAWTVGNFAQGKHHVAARAWDAAGNTSLVAERDILVDRLAPSSALTDNTYVVQPPARKTGVALTLAGVSNDAGNAPLPSSPKALASNMDVLTDTTVWLGVPAVADAALGVVPAWLGDLDNDRMADLAVGLPAAAEQAGEVRLVYGRAGDWAVPPTPEMLTNHTKVLTGEPGRRLGTLVSAAGDANGDGLADLMVGEANTQRAFLAWGAPQPIDSTILSAPTNGYAVQLDADAPITGLNWASDVNDDGLDDLLVLVGTRAYLVLGQSNPWPLYVDVEKDAAAVFSGILSIIGLGDVDGDLIGDLGAARANAVDLYLGSATLAREAGQTLSAAHTFATADAAPVLASLGDTNGDTPTALADFAYSDGATPRIVLGRTSGGWGVSQSLSGLAGYLVGVGDVNADGYGDLLAQVSGSDNASLRYGGSLGANRATFNDVRAVAGAPYSAAADINADGSADMLFVPTNAVANERGYGALSFAAAPFLPPDALPVGAEALSGAIGHQGRDGASVTGPHLTAGVTYYVDDDGATPQCPNCISTIQNAISSASSGDTIVIYPGVYARFSIGSGKNNLNIYGVNPDAVFVDGGGAASAIALDNVTGVSLSKLTLRNATVGIALTLAGVGGNTESSLRINIDRVASVCAQGVSMDSASSVNITNSTLAASTRHLTVSDASIGGDWSSVVTPSIQTNAGGGLVASRRSGSDRLYAIRGGGNKAVYHADMDSPSSWSTINSPVGFAPNSVFAAASNTGGLLAVAANPVPGVTSNIIGMAVSGSGRIYTAHADGSVRFWNGSSWTASSQTFSNLNVISAGGDYVFVGAGADVWKYSESQGAFTFTKVLHVWNYAESCFYIYPDCRYSGCDEMCRTIEGASPAASINALLVDGNNLYVGGSFDRLGDIPIECSMEHDPVAAPCPLSDIDTGYYNLLKFDISAGTYSKLGLDDAHNGVGAAGDVIRALTLSGGYLYIGGRFYAHYGSPQVISPHFIRMNVSTETFEACHGGLEGSDHQVYALAAQGNYVLVGGSFDTVGSAGSSMTASNLARFNTSTNTWASGEGSVVATNGLVRDIDVYSTSYFYVAGDFTQIASSYISNRIAKFSSSGSPYSEWGATGANAAVHALAVVGTTLYAGGAFTQIGVGSAGSGRALRFSQMDDSGSNTWAAEYTLWLAGSSDAWFYFTPPAASIGEGAAAASDGADGIYLLTGGGATSFYSLVWGGGSWTQLENLPVAANAGTALVRAWDRTLGRMVVLAAVGGSNQIYRYDPSAASGSRWSAGGTLPSGYSFSTGASMAWDGVSGSSSKVYVLTGGSSGNNSRAFFAYSGGAFATLGDGNPSTASDDDLPVSVGVGGGLVADVTDGQLLALPGRGVNPPTLYQYEPVGSGIPVGRLAMSNCALVAPAGEASFTWLTPEAASMSTFNLSISNNTFVGQNGISWTPSTGSYSGSTTLTHAQAAFADTTRGLYRTNNSTLTKGYYTYRGEVYVSPNYCPTCSNDGRTWGTNAFSSIQTAINSGARIVRALPGAYREALQLVSGVSVYGAGAELTLLEPKTVNTGAVVKGEGVTNVSLVGLSIVGNGTTEGVHLDAGAHAGVIKRVIVRGASNGIGLDGSGTQAQVLNCNLVGNGKGLAATNKAWLQVRNTVIANNTTTGVQYDSTATTVSHTYNDYWNNGTNLSPAGAGAGELFLDPLFADAAGQNYRPLETSPLIDAGAVSDPTPTGAGGRIDIGYREYGAASFYASSSYCSTCANDGLDWQVNAFDNAQDALDAAAAEVRVLASALAMRRSPLVTVSLSAGTYNEQVRIPSYVHLVGAGADRTIINAGGAYALSFDGVVGAQADGLRLTGATTAGLWVTHSSAAITVTRSILTGNAAGARFDARSSGAIEFSTIVTNTGAGVTSNAAHTHATVRNSLIAHNAQGLVSTSSGLVANDYNLLYNTADLSAVTAGENTIYSAPLLNGYNLTTASPAVDAADSAVDAPAGGGRRADLGWRELLALPIPLYLGAEHDSIVTANSGVAGVEIGVVAVADASEPVTATAPSSWTAGTLASPGDCVSTWTSTFTPNANGLHRIYARARDVVNNREDDENEWYVGSFVADNAAPLVAWVDPTTNTSTGAAAIKLQARAYDYLDNGSTTNFNVRSAWFTVDGVRLSGEWDDTGFDPSALTYRTFYAWAPLAIGTHTVVAWAEDASGRQTSTGSLTITVNGASHVVTVTSLSEGGYTNLASLPLAGYVRFVTTGEGSVSVSVDGGGAVAATLADPNAAVSAWTASAALNSDGSHALTITPQRGVAGVATTLNVTRDMTLPSLAAAKPQPGDYVTRTVTFEGTALDATAGLDRVEISLDGGYSWRKAALSGSNYSLDWSVDGAQDFDSYPASVRAVDRAGNVQETDAPVTVDNTPPTPLGATTFSKPVGQFVEVGTLLGVAWSEAFDASGVVEVLVDADQSADTAPTTERSGAYVDLTLNALGEWYVHVAVRDAAGNAVISHYGPWYTRRATGDLANQQQRIIVDGYMNLASGEWDAATQQLDDDERSGRSYVLYTVWDGTDFYLGWQNAYWGIDGDLMTYLALGGASGTRDPIRPLPQGQLPSPANACIEITGATSGTLWLYDGGWVARPLAFAVGPTGDTEVRVPWADMADGAALANAGRGLTAAPSSLSMLALALGPDGNVNSIFPTTNNISQSLTSSYNWSGLGGNPNTGAPQAKNVTLAVSSPQVSGAAWGPSNEITYTIAVRNWEAAALSGLKLALAATPGLSLMTFTGATCATAPCSGGASAWLLAAPEVAAGGSVTITVKGQLAASLSAYRQVTMTTVLTADYALMNAPVIAQLSHRVDGQAPTVSFAPSTTVVGPNATTILGAASDGDGVGVAQVELSVDGGPWQTVGGTIAWSAVVTPGASATSMALKARATDGYSHQSPEASLNLMVDRTAPAVSLDLGSLLGGRYAQVVGVASDATGVAAVEVQLDDEDVWRPAQVTFALAGDAQPYNWVWSLPSEDNAPHRLRARALDTAGNIGMTDWFNLQVDSIAPVVTATQVVSSVVATGDGESSLDGASTPGGAESVEISQRDSALRITRMGRASLLADRMTVLTGTVTDGGGVASIWMRVYDPLGQAYTQPVTLVGDAWSYNVDTYNLPVGAYRLHIETTDLAGNLAAYGPWGLEVEEQGLAGLQVFSNAPQAVGSAVSFRATITAGSNVSYTWAFGDGQTGSGRLVTHGYSAAGIYTATVTAANSLSQISATISLLIATPVGSVMVNNDGPTALGNQTVLTASASGSTLTYNWALGDGTTANGAIVTHTYAAVGTYTATVVVSNSASSSTAATTIEVDAPIQGLTAANDGPTALGAMTGLLAEVSAGSRISYTWAFGDGASATGAAVKHAYPDGGSYTAVVTASNSVSSQSAQTLVNVIGSSDALRVTPLGEFYCAGWNHGFEIAYTNESQADIGDVIVTITVPTRTLALYDLSSPGMIVDEGAGVVSWNLGVVEGLSTVTRLLVLHFFTSIENEGVVQVNASAECSVCPPTFASASVVVSTGGACLLPQPTSTPTPTHGPTPTPSATPTLGPTPEQWFLGLPLIMRGLDQ